MQEETPQPEIQPTPTTPEAVPSQPVATETALQGAKKSKKPLIIGLIIAGVLAIAAALFFILFFPKLQAEATASSFMTAIKNNDDAKMTELSGEGGDAITTRTHDGLEGATYKLASTDSTDKGFNVHFNVSDSALLNSVTIVVESNQVTNVVLDSKAGTLEDSTSSDTIDMSSLACISVANLKSLDFTTVDNLSVGSDQVLQGFYFKSRSTTYDSHYFNDIKKVASLYTNFSDKAFTIVLRGSADEAKLTDFGTQLAKDRAAKVKTELIAAGVPAGRITIEEIDNARANNSSSVFRNVLALVSLPAHCKA